MDAASQRLVALMTNASQRFIVPVYQRPYSWGEEQCAQLWDDVLAVGRREGDATHFTGSVVWVQQGVMSASGVTPVLIIDGQQRITTVTLLLVALAEYARDHADEPLAFSREEILGSGYLINPYKHGEEHYKLTLSQGDRDGLRSLIDRLEDPEAPIDADGDSRLVRNLGFFRRRLEALGDANPVWLGIQRLQVVSVSLDQGRDNPQLIFESMNSTGKDLSSADLIRNFVLMSLPADEQERLYRNHWRRIELALGEDYDEVFDDFIRGWLTVLYAPEPLVRRDVYSLFKRHVLDNGYDRDGRIADLLREMERFAVHYASIVSGGSADPEAGLRLGRIVRLGVSVANPLLMSILDDHARGAFPREDLLAMLDDLEGYLLRRAVCDCAANSLSKFFSSLIARLNAVQDEGGDYRAAFESMLLTEAGTARRFPADAEFAEALRTRDCYGFRRSMYLLSRLENSYHPKDERDFATGAYTIEHIMPRNAMAHEEWRVALGEDCEELHAQLVNTLGNLTITAYNSELSDGTFAQKKERAVGGYDNEYMSISAELHDADEWGSAAIRARGARLAERAVQVWPLPAPPEDAFARYSQRRREAAPQRIVKLADLLAAGLIAEGAALVPRMPGTGVPASVTAAGAIRLEGGEEFASPSPAAVRASQLATGSDGARNGWHYWRLPDGRLLEELRREYLGRLVEGDSERHHVRAAYWDGLYDYCACMPEFVEAFGDPALRQTNKANWASFGIGLGSCHPDAKVSVQRGTIAVDLWCTDLGFYARLHERLPEVEEAARRLGGELSADGVEEAVIEGDYHKKTRAVVIERPADFSSDDWEGLYAWHAEGLLRMRALALSV